MLKGGAQALSLTIIILSLLSLCRMDPAIDISTTYGSILLGAAIAFGLTGAVSIQCIVYFKLYPEDQYPTKSMVVAVWFLDSLHSCLICAALFDYFITFFGSESRIDHISWTIAFSVLTTAVQTFLVHCFFAQKILKSSKNNWYITGPIVILALMRLLAATVSTIEMIRLHSFRAFVLKYPGWVFTTGLSLSSGVDIIIMGWLCYFLREIRTRMGSRDDTVMIRVVDSLTLYTLENGALTCVATTASLICWLSMSSNLVFLGLHFVIGKLYANSLLASLNTRQELREIQSQSQPSRTWRNNGESSSMRTYPRSILKKPSIPKVKVVEDDPEIPMEPQLPLAFNPTDQEDINDFSNSYLPRRRRQPRDAALIQWRPAPAAW
ncbi:hypothetical protein BDQ12DRAFT_738270 [Crucibulum laeve]|uniref:DUF6534 domain-containing protein n=1 Tax=Crucibulum laeve TaxID=68775 RepID=A0A5C3LND8_9AGAR|nr:hypothetical protein BDQ12DRAFT_738270 [Crucibulum laeve]